MDNRPLSGVSYTNFTTPGQCKIINIVCVKRHKEVFKKTYNCIFFRSLIDLLFLDY